MPDPVRVNDLLIGFLCSELAEARVSTHGQMLDALDAAKAQVLAEEQEITNVA